MTDFQNIEIDDRVLAQLRREYLRRRSISFVFRIYVALGTATALVGVGFVLLDLTSTPVQYTVMSAGIAGATLAVVSVFALRWYGNRRFQPPRDVIDELTTRTFISHWEVFTTAAGKALQSHGVEIEDRSPLYILSALEESEILDSREVYLLYKLADTRNALSHGISEKPLLEITPSLLGYLDLITENLSQAAASRTETNAI